MFTETLAVEEDVNSAARTAPFQRSGRTKGRQISTGYNFEKAYLAVMLVFIFNALPLTKDAR